MYTCNKVLEKQERKGLQKGVKPGLRRGRLKGHLEEQVKSMMAALLMDPRILRVLLQNSEPKLLSDSFGQEI
jgi:hypothetical protein